MDKPVFNGFCRSPVASLQEGIWIPVKAIRNEKELAELPLCLPKLRRMVHQLFPLENVSAEIIKQQNKLSDTVFSYEQWLLFLQKCCTVRIKSVDSGIVVKKPFPDEM